MVGMIFGVGFVMDGAIRGIGLLVASLFWRWRLCTGPVCTGHTGAYSDNTGGIDAHGEAPYTGGYGVANADDHGETYRENEDTNYTGCDFGFFKCVRI